MDSGKIRTEGTVTGDRNIFNIPISIELFVATESLVEITAQLESLFDIRDEMVVPVTQHRPLTGRPSPQRRAEYIYDDHHNMGPAEYEAFTQTSIAINTNLLRTAPEKFGMTIHDLERLPVAKQPKEIKTKMLKYQLQGLAWLLQMEHPMLPQGCEIKQFWTKKDGNWFNVATCL